MTKPWHILMNINSVWQEREQLWNSAGVNISVVNDWLDWQKMSLDASKRVAEVSDQVQLKQRSLPSYSDKLECCNFAWSKVNWYTSQIVKNKGSSHANTWKKIREIVPVPVAKFRELLPVPVAMCTAYAYWSAMLHTCETWPLVGQAKLSALAVHWQGNASTDLQ